MLIFSTIEQSSRLSPHVKIYSVNVRVASTIVHSPVSSQTFQWPNCGARSALPRCSPRSVLRSRRKTIVSSIVCAASTTIHRCAASTTRNRNKPASRRQTSVKIYSPSSPKNTKNYSSSTSASISKFSTGSRPTLDDENAEKITAVDRLKKMRKLDDILDEIRNNLKWGEVDEARGEVLPQGQGGQGFPETWWTAPQDHRS